MTVEIANDQLRVCISGAAGGIGLACAAAFAERGAELILCDHDGIGLTRASDAFGAFSRFCDVVSEASVTVFAAEITELFPSIDVLINAAGSAYVRSLGMIRLSRALLPLLRKGTGRRLIVSIVPGAGPLASDGMFPYAGSREGFERLSEALAEQVRGTSIQVVSLAPHVIRERFDMSEQSSVYRVHSFERVDEAGTADEIVSLVAGLRPGWRARPERRNRRA